MVSWLHSLLFPSELVSAVAAGVGAGPSRSSRSRSRNRQRVNEDNGKKFFNTFLKAEIIEMAKNILLFSVQFLVLNYAMNNSGLGPDGSTKKISRVESLKNLILHGKIEPDLPPDVFNYPYCSCR